MSAHRLAAAEKTGSGHAARGQRRRARQASRPGARARANNPPRDPPVAPSFGDRAGRAADGLVTERHILLRDG